MSMFRCGGGKKLKDATIVLRTYYSYERGNWASADTTIPNVGWRRLAAGTSSNIQYANVYDADTGECLNFRGVTQKEDISMVKNMRFQIQSVESQNATAVMNWTLYA